ncbi:MAG: DUF3987 domain-containing protein [Alphaproteobacteria bacterium]|nr:DUF3987 domain-containing protein [Alphaproteobacteria bacterium]
MQIHKEEKVAQYGNTESDEILNHNHSQSNIVSDESQDDLIDKNNVYCVNNMTLAEAAGFYAAKGLKVLALAEKDKRPDGRVCPNGFKDATNDLTKVKSAWKQLPNLNIGIVTGKENGIVVVDIDGDVGKETWRNLIRQHEYKSKTLKIATGKGCHLYFKYPSALSVIKNRVRFVEGIDVRADGGYIVAAPSVHPSGRKYQVSRPINFSELEELPDWLLKLILDKNSVVEIDATGVNLTGQKLPLDVKNALMAISTTQEGSRHNMVISQSNLIAGKCLQGKLDEKDAKNLILQAALKTGLSEKEILQCIADGFNHVAEHTANTASAFRNAYFDEYAPVASENDLLPWEEPILEKSIETRQIPEKFLPNRFKNVLTGLASALQVDLGLTLVTALSVVSACVQGHVKVAVSSSWVIPVNLYIIGIAESGERKSGIIKFLSKPLLDWDKKQMLATQDKILELQIQNEMKMARYKRLIGQDVLSDDEKKEAIELKKAISEPQLEASHVIVNDATPEALVKYLASNDGCGAIITDEGGLFETLAGLYSKNQANTDLMLKAWDGTVYSQIRVGRNDCYIESPLLTFGILAQPVVIKKMMEKDAFIGNGFKERFIFYQPESKLGSRNSNPPDMTEEQKNCFSAIMSELFSLRESGRSIVLTLSEEVHTERQKLNEKVEMLFKKGVGKKYPAFVSKLQEKIIRIAALYHLIDNGINDTTIDIDDFRKACALGNIFLGHFHKIMSSNDASEEQKLEREVVSWILRQNSTQFKKRDLTYAFKDKCKAKDLNPILNRLIDKHIINIPVKYGNNTLMYNVNPALFPSEKE